MTDKELMQMALDALKEYVGVVVSVNDPNDWTPKVADAGEPARKAIEALRARLAQPNQFNPDWDAVAVMVEEQQRMAKELKAQREWQGLTDDQMFAVLVSVDETAVRFPDGFRQFAKAIEAKLKEKNT